MRWTSELLFQSAYWSGVLMLSLLKVRDGMVVIGDGVKTKMGKVDMA